MRLDSSLREPASGKHASTRNWSLRSSLFVAERRIPKTLPAHLNRQYPASLRQKKTYLPRHPAR